MTNIKSRSAITVHNTKFIGLKGTSCSRQTQVLCMLRIRRAFSPESKVAGCSRMSNASHIFLR